MVTYFNKFAFPRNISFGIVFNFAFSCNVAIFYVMGDKQTLPLFSESKIRDSKNESGTF